MTMRFEFTVNLPPKECGGNKSGSGLAKAAAIKLYRAEACLECWRAFKAWSLRNIYARKDLPIRIETTFYTFETVLTANRYRPRDYDNALRSCKPIIDGITDTKIVPHDSKKWVRPEIPVLKTTAAEAKEDGVTRPCVKVWVSDYE